MAAPYAVPSSPPPLRFSRDLERRIGWLSNATPDHFLEKTGKGKNVPDSSSSIHLLAAYCS